nr:MAG TPA: tail baseplate attachment protein [Caudoviricetes sp.]
MLLEYNLYENFNPNVMSKEKEENPQGNMFPKGYPKPFGRGVLLDYEVWQTGFEYTSTAVMTIEAHVGDIVEVLLPIDDNLALSPTQSISQKMSIWYVVTNVDESNKVTMQNYYWYSIEGNSYATANIFGWASSAWGWVSGIYSPQVMVWGDMANWDETNLEIKFNMKADTVEAKELAKDLFAKMLLQPITVSYNMTGVSRPQLHNALLTDEWTRKQKQLRIDEVQNPAIEQVVVTERSNYNFVNVFVKDPQTEKYPLTGIPYTITDDNQLVNFNNYKGDTAKLPELRVIKTMFYDDQPTDAQIKSEVAQDSVVHKIYFNQHKLYPLQTNDLVKIWYNGTEYNGYIADRGWTSDGTERLVFMEGNRG